MEHELDEENFHDAKDGYNYATVPGLRWSCSKIFLHDGRGYVKDGISVAGDRLYLKCRKDQKPNKNGGPHQKRCKGRAIVTGKKYFNLT